MISFFLMSSCTFFRCVVNIYFATCDFLHFPTLQGHFKPFLTVQHSSLQVEEGESLQEYNIKGYWKDFFNFVVLVG